MILPSTVISLCGVHMDTIWILVSDLDADNLPVSLRLVAIPEDNTIAWILD